MTRQEAIINLKLSQNRIGGMKKEEWVALQMAIEALESERQKGEWMLVDHLWQCDQCQYRQNKSKPTNFCPNCGADMRENDHQRHIEDQEHCMRYEPTYNPEDGSM